MGVVSRGRQRIEPTNPLLKLESRMAGEETNFRKAHPITWIGTLQLENQASIPHN